VKVLIQKRGTLDHRKIGGTEPGGRRSFQMNLKTRAGNGTTIAGMNQNTKAQSIGTWMNRIRILSGFQLQKGGFRRVCERRDEQEQSAEQEW
jgi:hypothetical protein